MEGISRDGEQRHWWDFAGESLQCVITRYRWSAHEQANCACEQSDDRSADMSNFLQDALRHLLQISIVLPKMSILETVKQVSGSSQP